MPDEKQVGSQVRNNQERLLKISIHISGAGRYGLAAACSMMECKWTWRRSRHATSWRKAEDEMNKLTSAINGDDTQREGGLIARRVFC